MNYTEQDITYMKLALEQAKLSLDTDDVPVGAVVVLDNRVIGVGHNTRQIEADITGHAEINALKDAAKSINNWQLNNATLYVTLEPCSMCTCAIVQAHIARVIYGADDEKAGACGSMLNLAQFPGFNHNVRISSGLLKAECEKLIKDFFIKKRNSGI